MTKIPFRIVDVFTDHPFGGNQLAVITNGRGLSTLVMQALAREFNFSETTFVLPPEDPANTYKVRIFTPTYEMPMAGHPVIGSTFALAREGLIPPGAPAWTFGLNIGPLPVDLQWREGALAFAWMTQNNPEFGRVEEIAPVVMAVTVETKQ